MSLGDTEESIALGFADDLVIRGGSIENAMAMSVRLNFLLNQIGLELNESKCHAFAINIPGAPEVLSPELPIKFLNHNMPC